jgi:hypothetical protein
LHGGDAARRARLAGESPVRRRLSAVFRLPRSGREVLGAELNCSESCGRRFRNCSARRQRSDAAAASDATSVLAGGWRNDILRDTRVVTQNSSAAAAAARASARASIRECRELERDDFSSNRHPALACCWSMIFSENRYPPRIKSGAGFFGIMLWTFGNGGDLCFLLFSPRALFLFLSFYLFIFLSFYLFIFLSFYLFIFLSFYLFIFALAAVSTRRSRVAAVWHHVAAVHLQVDSFRDDESQSTKPI